MKTLKKITFLLLTVLIVGCSSNNNSNSPTNTNKFTIQNTDFSTPNAYVLVEDNPTPEDAFFLGFLDGTLAMDPVNTTTLTSTNTNNLVVLLVNHGGTVSGQQNINLNAGQTYSLDKQDSAVLTNIGAFTNLATINGSQYGEPDGTQSTVSEIENTGSGTVTINTLTIDYVAKTGTIDCNYTITDDNGVSISGSYSGNFNIIVNNI